jgi:hypothetical protein
MDFLKVRKTLDASCDDGAICVMLAEACKTVISSDLYNRGFGDIGVDFLSDERSANNIIANPVSLEPGCSTPIGSFLYYSG